LKIRLAIYTFFNKFREKCHLNNVVFDVFVTMQQHSGVSFQVKLLELNPFFEKTDPCLFSWHNGENFDGSVKFL